MKNLKNFKYLGSLLTNQNSIHDKMKCWLKAEDSCCYSVQTLLSSRILSKNLKIKIYKTIFPVVLYGCETWSGTLKEEFRLKAFENRVLRRIFGIKGMWVEGSTMRKFMVYTVKLK